MADSTHCYSSFYRRTPESVPVTVRVDPPFKSQVDQVRAFAPIVTGVPNAVIQHWAICAENHPEGDTEVFGPKGIIAIGQPLSSGYEAPDLATYLVKEHSAKAHPDIAHPNVIVFAQLTPPRETRIPASTIATEVLRFVGSTPMLTPLLAELRQNPSHPIGEL